VKNVRDHLYLAQAGATGMWANEVPWAEVAVLASIMRVVENCCANGQESV